MEKFGDRPMFPDKRAATRQLFYWEERKLIVWLPYGFEAKVAVLPLVKIVNNIDFL